MYSEIAEMEQILSTLKAKTRDGALFRQTLDEQIKSTNNKTPSEIKYTEFIEKMRSKKQECESPMSLNDSPRRMKTLRYMKTGFTNVQNKMIGNVT